MNYLFTLFLLPFCPFSFSCLFCLLEALPKVSFTLCCCPPSYIQEAFATFSNAIQDSLSDLVGGPVLKWCWLKATSPVSFGGLGIRRASLHAPAAYINSFNKSKPLVARILGETTLPSKHIHLTVTSLAKAAGSLYWSIAKTLICHSISTASPRLLTWLSLKPLLQSHRYMI